MSLAVTLLGSATFTTAAGSKSVTATPAAGDLILIVAAHSGNNSTAVPTDDQGGTYSLVASTFKNVSADGLAVFVRNQLIGSAVSTVFTHAPGTTTGGGLAVLNITGGVGGLAAIRQSAKEINKAFGGTPAPVFPAAPKSASAIIGAVLLGGSSGAMNPRTGYTERVDAGYLTPSAALEVMSRDAGEANKTITWGTPAVGEFCDIVVEITAPQILTASLLSNSNSFQAPSIKFAALKPARFANANVFYAPAASVDGALSAAIFVNANAFHDPSIARAPLEPELFANTNSFHGASIGTVSELDATLLANDNVFYGTILTGWTNQTGDDTTWTPVVNTAALTDENGDPILDESGEPITAEGDEVWNTLSNNATSWTQAA